MMTFKEACKLTEDQAREYLEKLRWGDTPFCVHCGSLNVGKLNGKSTKPGTFKCKDRTCRKKFSVTVNSIFTDSHVELKLWVMAFALMCASKKGISALQLQRMLGLGSYRTAWHINMRIRHAMKQEPVAGLLQGTCECDETWVGPRKDRRTGKNWHDNKTAVMAIIRREGGIRTRVIGRVTKETLKEVMDEMIHPESDIMTDGLLAYKRLAPKYRSHQSVNHTEREYSRDGVGVNSCEAFFSLLKRGIAGSFHHVSREHLQRYCDEFSFRWGHRKITDAERTELALRLAPNCTLRYNKTA